MEGKFVKSLDDNLVRVYFSFGAASVATSEIRPKEDAHNVALDGVEERSQISSNRPASSTKRLAKPKKQRGGRGSDVSTLGQAGALEDAEGVKRLRKPLVAA